MKDFYFKDNNFSVSFGLSNSFHGDDQIFVRELGNVVIFALSDGVSSSNYGKLASTVLLTIVESFVNKYGDKLNTSDSINQYKKLIPDFAINSLKDNFQAFIKSSINFHRNTEENDDIHQSYQKKMGQYLNKEDKDQKSGRATFIFGMIYKNSNDKNFTLSTYSLGDSMVHILNDELKLFPHYELPPMNKLPSYVCLQKGAVGRVDISSRTIYPNDKVIISSDGANVKYANFGVQGEYFSKFYTSFENKYKSINGLPSSWFQHLDTQNALKDDSSIIVISPNKRIGRFNSKSSFKTSLRQQINPIYSPYKAMEKSTQNSIEYNQLKKKDVSIDDDMGGFGKDKLRKAYQTQQNISKYQNFQSNNLSSNHQYKTEIKS